MLEAFFKKFEETAVYKLSPAPEGEDGIAVPITSGKKPRGSSASMATTITGATVQTPSGPVEARIIHDFQNVFNYMLHGVVGYDESRVQYTKIKWIEFVLKGKFEVAPPKLLDEPNPKVKVTTGGSRAM